MLLLTLISSYPILTLTTLLTLFCVYRILFKSNLTTWSSKFQSLQGPPLPPSPPLRFPILGHLFELWSLARDAPLALYKLSKKYGPIYHLQFGKKTIVVIADASLAKETMIQKGKIYADRAVGQVMHRISEGGKDVAMAPYGEHWRKVRRIANKLLTPSNFAILEPSLIKESNQFFMNLYENQGQPINVSEEGMLVTINVILTTLLKTRFPSTQDPMFRFVRKSISTIFDIAAAAPFEDLVHFKWLSKLIAEPKLKKADELIETYQNQFILKRLLELQANLSSTTSTTTTHTPSETCFAEGLLMNVDTEEGLDMCTVKHVVADMLAAGMDTTSSTWDWMLVYLANHPDLQLTLYEEIRQVTNESGLPGLEHFHQLPLVRGFIKEILRLHPVAPLGIPRSTLQDDILAGYTIPKGAEIMYQMQAIHESQFGVDPNLRLERWSTSTNTPAHSPSSTSDSILNATTTTTISNASSEILEGGLFTFGQGRRMCPGIHVAYRELYLLTARLVFLFEIHRLHESLIPLDPYFSLTMRPKAPLVLKFQLRNPEYSKFILQGQE